MRNKAAAQARSCCTLYRCEFAPGAENHAGATRLPLSGVGSQELSSFAKVEEPLPAHTSAILAERVDPEASA